MKVIIQIPALNEEETLPATLADLPREIEGVDEIETLVIDDGSTDRTIEVARQCGVDHIVKLPNNRGLATGFQSGLDACLKLGADIVVNTDADNQYSGSDIPKLVAPIRPVMPRWWSGTAKWPRSITSHRPRRFSRSSAAGSCASFSNTEVTDTTSGFRAYNREAALQLLVVDNFTYTLESLIRPAGERRGRRGHDLDQREDPRVPPVRFDFRLCAPQRLAILGSTPATSRSRSFRCSV